MGARLLTLLVMIGLVIAPWLPKERLFICQMTGEIHTFSSCCCDNDQAIRHEGHEAHGSGCCKVITIQATLTPGQSLAPTLPIDRACQPLALPIAPVERLLTVNRSSSPMVRQVLTQPPDLLFVRNCSWLI